MLTRHLQTETSRQAHSNNAMLQRYYCTDLISLKHCQSVCPISLEAHQRSQKWAFRVQACPHQHAALCLHKTRLLCLYPKTSCMRWMKSTPHITLENISHYKHQDKNMSQIAHFDYGSQTRNQLMPMVYFWPPLPHHEFSEIFQSCLKYILVLYISSH